MATKKISAMTVATTIADADLIPIVQGGTNKSSSFGLIRANADYTLKVLQGLGSVALAYTLPPYVYVGTTSLVDTREYMVPIYLPKAATVTGVKFVQTTQGNYTGDQNNRVGLYSVAAGVLTLVASCANDANFWVNAAGIVTKAFSVPYAAPAGVYYIGYLYNNSAQTAAPVLAGHAAYTVNMNILDLANDNKLVSYFDARTDLVPSTTTMAGTSNATIGAFFMLY